MNCKHSGRSTSCCVCVCVCLRWQQKVVVSLVLISPWSMIISAWALCVWCVFKLRFTSARGLGCLLFKIERTHVRIYILCTLVDRKHTHRAGVAVVLTHIWPIISGELPICLLSQHQASHDATHVHRYSVRTHTHTHAPHTLWWVTSSAAHSSTGPVSFSFLTHEVASFFYAHCPCCVGSVFCLVDVFCWGEEVTHLWPKKSCNNVTPCPRTT